MAMRHALQWKTFPRQTKSAFSPETVQHLASKFGFVPDNIQALGIKLLTTMTSPLKEPDERLFQHQRTKGEARRDRARASIQRAKQALAIADREMSNLKAEDAHVLGAFDRNPANWHSRLRKIAAELERLQRDLKSSGELEHELLDPTESDKRLDRDHVRIKVLNEVFLFWREQGLPLSLTTRPDRASNNITGRLLDFARDVVAALTTRANILSADTLKVDLKRARAHWKDCNYSQPPHAPK